MNADIPIIDYMLTLGFLWFYIVGPAKHIKNTAMMWNAYGEDGDGLRQRLIRQYWQVPLAILIILLLTLILSFYFDLGSDFRSLAGLIVYLSCYAILIWPAVMLVRSYSKRTGLEKWKQQDLEYRIASGMASSGDIHGYMHGVKKQEYEKGYWDGYRTPRPRH
jgi:hypothetical protein